MLKLRILLESPLCSGSGLSRPGVADREVVFDECGLPWLPGRRLKGLLRDAYREFTSVFTPEELGLPTIEDLFGHGGREIPGALDVRNAFPPDYDALREWAMTFTRGAEGVDRRAAIMESFSAVRRQTAMNRGTGAPKQDTLRGTRILHPGLVFEAALPGDLTLSQRWALSLAAAALRQMGSSRWRGLGKVRCEVVEHRRSGKVLNWTEAALGGLTGDGFAAKEPEPEAPVADTIHTSPAVTGDVLRYELLLEDPAVFPILAGDPNTVNTAGHIPGSVIHGWFARRHGAFDAEEFRHLFTSGEVRFLNAHPEVEGERSQRLPHSIRRRKGAGQDVALVDLAVTEGVREIRRLESWCHSGKLAKGNLARVEPDRDIHYHHARAADARLQRAIGIEEAERLGIAAEKAGAFFQYEALAAGQKFIGEIRGTAADLSRIRQLVNEGSYLQLGRSRRAQYGGRALLKWMAPTPLPVAATRPVSSFRVIARSAVLGCNQWGHPVPRFPIEELEAALGCGLSIRSEFSRTHWEGGYLAHLLLPRPQFPTWAAGSVLVVVAAEPIDAGRLAEAAQRGYGLRREHGYGEIDIIAEDTPERIYLLETQPAVGVSVATHPAAKRLALQVFHVSLRRATRRAATGLVQVRVKGRLPSKALLHRLLRMLDIQTEAEFRTALQGLRDRARRQLEGCRVLRDQGLVSKDTDLTGFLGMSQDGLGESLVRQHWANGKWRQALPELPPTPEHLGREFLSEFLAALAKEAGKEERQS